MYRAIASEERGWKSATLEAMAALAGATAIQAEVAHQQLALM
jgi:hypothetical protein